jgi:hypothetical protein
MKSTRAGRTFRDTPGNSRSRHIPGNPGLRQALSQHARPPPEEGVSLPMRRDKVISQSSTVPVRLRTRTGKGRNPSRTRHRNRRTPPLQRIGVKKSVVPPITTAKRLQEHGASQVLPRSYHRCRSPRNVYGGASRADARGGVIVLSCSVPCGIFLRFPSRNRRPVRAFVVPGKRISQRERR